MGMMENGYSLADAVALTGGNYNNRGLFSEDLIGILFLIFIMGGGRFGNLFGMGNDVSANAALTRAELMDGFNFNQIDNGIRGLQSGLCDGFYTQNTTMLQGFNTIGREIDQARFDSQACCCETNRNIDALRYDGSKNTCDIINSATLNTRDIIDSQNAGFQRILDFMTNDKIESLRTELQAAQLALQNNAQTQTLISSLRPCPVPAYPSCSPYEVTSWVRSGCNNCGC